MKGSSTSEYLLYFLGEIAYVLWKNDLNKKVLYILDQAKTHQSQIVKDNFLNRVNFLYTAKCSPQLNPIELVFGQLKKHLAKSKINDEMDLERGLLNAFKKVSKEHIQNYFRHTLSFY